MSQLSGNYPMCHGKVCVVKSITLSGAVTSPWHRVGVAAWPRVSPQNAGFRSNRQGRRRNPMFRIEYATSDASARSLPRKAVVLSFALRAILAFAGTAGPAQATTYTVCPTGCDYTSIQAAIDDPAPGRGLHAGNTIQVLSGTYHLASILSITSKSGTAAQPAVLQATGNVVLDCTDDFSNAALWTHVSGSVYSASRAADAMNPPDTQVYVSDVLYTYVSGSNYSSLAPGHWGYDLPTQRSPPIGHRSAQHRHPVHQAGDKGPIHQRRLDRE